MTSNNLYIIIFILIILGLAVYIYYNKTPDNLREGYKTNKIKQNKKSSKTKKQVRFDDNIEYRIFTPIDVDEILYTDEEKSVKIEDTKIDDKIDIDQILSPDKNKIDESDIDKSWYTMFDKPLMTNNEKKQYYDKVSKNYKDYEKSLDQFGKYQTDDSTVIKTDITIDMFAPEKINNNNKTGTTIKDIYNEMVKAPTAKPKKIKCKNPENIIYEDESEMNGGNISGSNLTGYDGINDEYQMANFNDDF